MFDGPVLASPHRVLDRGIAAQGLPAYREGREG